MGLLAIALGAVLIFSVPSIMPSYPNVVSADDGEERTFQSYEQYDEAFIVRTFKNLTPYVTVNEDKSLSFDKDGARAAGISNAAILAGREFVEMSNEHLQVIKEESVYSDRIDRAKVHKFERFFLAVAEGRLKEINEISETAVEENLFGLIQRAHAQSTACGGYNQNNPHPCPNWQASGTYKPTLSQMEGWLTNVLGYHKTAGYASGYNNYDYTKGCDAYGCYSPIFRTQAIIQQAGSQWTYSYQTPEPNPEVLSYVWPVYWWRDYVEWWHAVHC